MAFSVETFKSRLPLGGARNSLFEVTINPPNGGLGADIPEGAKYLVRAAQLPASTMGTIPVQYFGRTVNFAGNRTFAPWTVTILNDEDFAIRNAVEEWSSKINGNANNLRDASFGLANQYKADLTVTQFSKTGVALRTYKFVGAYPSDIAAIPLDWGSETIEEFDVTWTYDFFTSESGGDFGTTLTTVINALT